MGKWLVTDICILFEISTIRSRYLNIVADISNLISDICNFDNLYSLNKW